jgi:import receptor subunit TOM22
MVEFEEIKDEHYEAGDGFEDDDEGSDGDYSDTSSEGDDFANPDLQDETLLDRLAALKDIIPADKRDAIARTLSKSYLYGSMATYIGGRAAYVIITSVLLLGIPYALAMEEDKVIGEQERQMQSQQVMSDVRFLLAMFLTCRFLRPQPLEQSQD